MTRIAGLILIFAFAITALVPSATWSLADTDASSDSSETYSPDSEPYLVTMVSTPHFHGLVQRTPRIIPAVPLRPVDAPRRLPDQPPENRT